MLFICPHCAQPVECTRRGLVAPHQLTEFSDILCKGAGRAPIHEERGAGRSDMSSKQERQSPELPAPNWLPSWRKQHRASLALPAADALRIWLPNTTNLGHIASIGTIMPTSARPIWDPSNQCWTIPKGYFLLIAGKLVRRYSSILLGREYHPDENCNHRCQNAQGPYCTCSCLAKNHGHGRWMRGFEQLDEFGTRYHGQSWHWQVMTLGR